jgi:peroxiredoxin Q/BCP
MLKQGDNAPDFQLTDSEGKSISLSQFRGKKVVVYFYPKDGTSG